MFHHISKLTPTCRQLLRTFKLVPCHRFLNSKVSLWINILVLECFYNPSLPCVSRIYLQFAHSRLHKCSLHLIVFLCICHSSPSLETSCLILREQSLPVRLHGYARVCDMLLCNNQVWLTQMWSSNRYACWRPRPHVYQVHFNTETVIRSKLLYTWS